MANNWYINYGNGSSTGYYAVAQWTSGHAYVNSSNGGRGDYVRQLATPAVGSERVFRCTTSGTSGGAEPTWTLTHNATTSDNTVVWTECTGAEADQGPAGGVWTAPHARLANAYASGWGASGDSYFLASNHAETRSTAMTLTPPGGNTGTTNVYCVTQTTVPPVSANLTTGASISTTGANTITNTLNTNAYYRGVTFNIGDGANSLNFTLAPAGNTYIYENCAIVQVATGATGQIITGSGASSSKLTLINTTLQFGNAGQQLNLLGAEFFYWKNTPSAIAGATLPTTLIVQGLSAPAIFEGVDFSALGSGKTIVGAAAATPGFIHFKDCKFGASVTVATAGTTAANWYSGPVLVSRSDSTGTNYVEQRYDFWGSQVNETTIVRTSGASDGTTAISRKIVTTANPTWLRYFECIPITIYNSITGTNRVVSMYGIINAAAVPNQDDIWFDVEYLGASTSPLGSFATTTKADNLAASSALGADTSAWDSLVTARGNTTAYTLGNTIKVSNNAGRVFFCTTAGTSSGSPPAGYGTAVDGGSVTDGTAVFRAGCRFVMTVTLTTPQPAQVGYLYAYLKAGKASTTWYVDPLIVLA